MTINTTRLLDDVHAHARELRPLRVLLTIIAFPFFLIGLAVRLVFGAVWIVFAWIWAAIVVGWEHGKREKGDQ